MTNFDQLQELLSSPKNVVITSHANPDGDAIGSSLAMYHYLQKMGHRVTVIMPTEMPDFLDWMPGYNLIWTYEKQMEQCKRIVEKADILFALDYNNFNRTEHMETILTESTAYKVMIDHHLFPDDFAQAILWRTSASSACELVYDFFALCDALEEVPMMGYGQWTLDSAKSPISSSRRSYTTSSLG